MSGRTIVTWPASSSARIPKWHRSGNPAPRQALASAKTGSVEAGSTPRPTRCATAGATRKAASAPAKITPPTR
ncbi:hypothetical protein [Sorangium sp. So ce128]|uniref:hypothetical protein n=1 Tax=Sorangium sp. So ce128 TaxID=3133281 RepID=UPI003F5E2389